MDEFALHSEEGLDTALESTIAAGYGILRQFAEEGGSEILDVLAATEAGIVGLTEIGHAEGDEQSQQEGDAEHHRL